MSEVGTCSMCGGECNWQSQACGPCMRGGRPSYVVAVPVVKPDPFVVFSEKFLSSKYLDTYRIYLEQLFDASMLLCQMMFDSYESGVWSPVLLCAAFQKAFGRMGSEHCINHLLKACVCICEASLYAFDLAKEDVPRFCSYVDLYFGYFHLLMEREHLNARVMNASK